LTVYESHADERVDEEMASLKTDNEQLRKELEELKRKVDAFILLHGT
jgi:predicted RNase H-like nuclease (RuvC/YqgF family)